MFAVENLHLGFKEDENGTLKSLHFLMLEKTLFFIQIQSVQGNERYGNNSLQ